jgi:rare lipoprotein A
MLKKFIAAGLTSLFLTGCVTTTEANSQLMVASWYMHGTRTANGERFIPDGMTAAHKTLPFGTKLRLTHRDKQVIVRINDRGPFIKGRHIDLSRGAAKALGCSSMGICTLKVEILK